MPEVLSPLHFLHVPKTGGTAISAALAAVADASPRPLVLHDHDATARRIPADHAYFFVVRDPVARFVSAFYSRQRRGRPRYDVAWTAEEALLFEHFATPRELAESLDADGPVRDRAVRAMGAVPHFRPMTHWLGTAEVLRRDAHRVFAVLEQEHLSEHFAALAARLGVTARLPEDDVGAHRNPATVDRGMSEAAHAALRRWYAEDEALLRACRDLAAA